MECGRQFSKQRFVLVNMRTLVLDWQTERYYLKGSARIIIDLMSGHTHQHDLGITKH